MPIVASRVYGSELRLLEEKKNLVRKQKLTSSGWFKPRTSALLWNSNPKPVHVRRIALVDARRDDHVMATSYG
jgi:hypothetical protein